jgi:hypothetical protein
LGSSSGNQVGTERYDGNRCTAAARKTIDLEGRLVKDGVRKALQERQKVLRDLVQAIREYRKLSDQPLTLRGSEYAHSVLELNKAIERAEELLTG